MDTLRIGSLGLPLIPLITLAGMALFHWLAGHLADSEEKARQAERVALLSLIAGICAARLSFVIDMWPVMKSAPWQIAALYDGGFIVEKGVIAGFAVAAILLHRNKVVLRPVVSAAGIALALTAGGQLAVKASIPTRSVADIAVFDEQNQPRNLGKIASGVKVINIWATWCPPCRKEMPMLHAMQQQSDVPIILVNQGEALADVREFESFLGVDLNNLYFDRGQQLSSKVGATVLPTTLFVDATGTIVSRHYGEISEAVLRHQLQQLQSKPFTPRSPD